LGRRRRGSHRDLIRKYADLFTETTTVKVDIHPESEWQPED
jgi:hypothetical protein